MHVPERLTESLQEMVVSSIYAGEGVVGKYIERLKQGKLTKEEDPKSHFCSFFIAYDKKAEQVYLGHHKKSNSWLCNGGHIDKGELPNESVAREANEEWGIQVNDIGSPKLLTITLIDNDRQPCKTHYDLWYFLPLQKDGFHPDRKLEEKEFYETRWLSIEEAKSLVTIPSVIDGLSFIENEIFNK